MKNLEIFLLKKNYVFAQRYYDSSARVIPEAYFNFEVIRNKADKLANLVRDIDIIIFEDSVQRIASMGEKDREQFVKDVIKQIQKEEQEKRNVMHCAQNKCVNFNKLMRRKIKEVEVNGIFLT